MTVVPLHEAEASGQLSGSVYLDAYLAPFRPWLERESVTETLVNRPGELWIDDAARPGMQRIELPRSTTRCSGASPSRSRASATRASTASIPLLAATLPDEIGGARIQLVGPPATRAHWALAIRRHRLLELPLDAYDRGPIVARRQAPMPDAQAQPIACLREAIRRRRTVLISGGTSTGKTTFLNALLGEIPAGERVVLVEDTAELKLPGANGLGLIAVKGELGAARVTADDLLQAALRLRPTASSWASCAARRPSASCARSTQATRAPSRPSTPTPRAARSSRSR